MSIVVKDDSYPVFNFVFKAIAPIILMVLYVAVVQIFNCRYLASQCYMIVIYYWMFRFIIILITGKFLLTNWKTQIIYWVTSIGLSLYLYQIIDKVDMILPSPESLRDQMWILIILFLYSVFNKIDVDRNGSQKRKDNYIATSYSRFISKYDDVVSKECNNYFFTQMVYSIMIYENFNRSKFIRWFEYFHFLLTKKPHTLGIMQVTSTKFINDEQSIILAIKKIRSDCNIIVHNYAKEHRDFSLHLIVERIAANYNKDDDYVREVSRLFETVTDLEKASSAFFYAYKHKKVTYDKDRYLPFYFK